MSSDFNELRSLAADLTAAPAGIEKYATSAVRVTAGHIKTDWKQGATIGHGYAKSYAAAISYDMTSKPGEVSVEIGPVLGRTPGASAGFLEEGGGGVDGPAHHAGTNAKEANEEDFIRGMEIAVFDATVKAVGG